MNIELDQAEVNHLLSALSLSQSMLGKKIVDQANAQLNEQAMQEKTTPAVPGDEKEPKGRGNNAAVPRAN